jgi:signal recognition particle GTPase
MNKQEQEEKELKEKIKIMHAMTEEELDDYHLISGPSKLEISYVAKCQVAEINKIIGQYEQFLNIHTWLHDLQDSGNPLPNSQEELYERYQANPITTETRHKKRNRKFKFSTKQRKEYLKYGENSIKF